MKIFTTIVFTIGMDLDKKTSFLFKSILNLCLLK